MFRADGHPIGRSAYPVMQQSKTFTDPSNSPILFTRIARWYDVMNRLMSLGRDRHWRGLAAEAAELPRGGRVLDVGVGTGDMTLALLERHPQATVVGLDLTAPMMHIGQGKPGMEKMHWNQGDGRHLPFPDQYFDSVVSSFLLRNVVDVPAVLSEQRRVVKRGGRVVCLEMSWPRTPIFGTLFRFYFAELMPRITGLLSGQPAAYRYLPRSVQDFLTPAELKSTMERIDLRSVRYRSLALGTVYLHVGER